MFLIVILISYFIKFTLEKLTDDDHATLKTVIEKYDQTIFVEEALHRLVEINFKLGLKDESQKYANILGYNYLSSDWYKKSYKVFNQDYSLKKNKQIKKDKKSVIERFKKLFD